MASKFSINNFLLIRKRLYAVTAENVSAVQGSGSAASLAMGKKKKKKEVSSMEKEEEVFWMRDPKSGNWVPETHFNQIDAAELRDKLLPRKTN